MVRSLAKPNSLSTQRSKSSFFLDLEEVLGATLCASETVTILSKISKGVPSAVHNNLALFSYITYDYKIVITFYSLCTKRTHEPEEMTRNDTNINQSDEPICCCPVVEPEYRDTIQSQSVKIFCNCKYVSILTLWSTV